MSAPVATDHHAETRQALQTLRTEFPAALEALRDAVRRNETGFLQTLLLHAETADGAKVLAALKMLAGSTTLLKEAAAAAHALERTEEGPISRFVPAAADERLLRAAPGRTPLPISRDQLLVIVKTPDVERDMHKLGLDLEGLRRRYQELDAETVDAAFSAYERQKTALAELRRHVRPEQIIVSDRLCREPGLLAGAGAVISFGGDDQLKLVSHYLPPETPIVAVNSDPGSSFGYLLDFWYQELPALLDSLERGEYRFEPWTRLRTELDGQELPSSLDSIFLGDAYRKRMSRHLISKIDADGTESAPMRQKGSGLLIATGSGSTGWFNSETWPFYPNGTRFEKSAPYARYFNTGFSASTGGAVERRGEDLKLPEGFEGILYPGEKLVVRSVNRGHGIATTDSFEEFSFGRGSVATVSIDPNPLWVIRKLAAA